MADVVTLGIRQLADTVRAAMEAGEDMTVIITGWSMAPTLYPHRDKAVISPIGEGKLKCGDIVMFERADGHAVLHRIIGIKRGAEDERAVFVMNGDAQSWTEEISGEQIIGKAGYIIRKGRRISCDSPAFRLHYKLWSLTRPFRKSLIAARRKMRGKTD